MVAAVADAGCVGAQLTRLGEGLTMSGRNRTGSTRLLRHRFWWRAFHRTVAVSAMLFLIAEVAVVAVSSVRPSRAKAATPPTGQGFTVTPGDLKFILKQINIAEQHAATATVSHPCDTLVATPGDGIPDANQIPDRLTSYGLRTVDGSCNDLIPGRETFGAADQVFPRLSDKSFRDADPVPPGFGPPGSTSYKQKKGDVFDSQPRTVSNLIVDQTSTNPAAIAAAGHPVRTQGNTGVVPCQTDPVVDPVTNAVTTPGVPAGCTPSHKTLFIPNVTTDVGLSPPYNSLFTFFGQFFDHGVDQTVKSGANVFVPLKADDPLRTLGPDGIPDAPAGQPGSHDAFRPRRRSWCSRAPRISPVPTASSATTRPRPRTRAPTTSKTRPTRTRPGSTRARPTRRIPRIRSSCASTPSSTASPSTPASCSAAPATARPAWRPGRR